MTRKDGLVKIGLTVFLTAAGILVFYDTLFGSKFIQNFWKELMAAIAPIVYGAFIAYLLAPVINFLEKLFFGERAAKAQRAGRIPGKGIRAVSLVVTWLIICVMVYLAAYVLLPELYKSVVQLIANIETYYNTVVHWVERLMEGDSAAGVWLVGKMNQYYLRAMEWLETDAVTYLKVAMVAVTGGLASVLTFVENLLIGAIVSVYLLATKERVKAQSLKITYSLFSRRNVRWVLRGTRKADSIFSGFVRGKLLDSLIIGILCFVGCSLLKMPYTPLISVIVGVTNVIPFFGPFLGAIPSTFLVLLVSPLQALYFAIFALALQQLDGNLIGPLILGDKTGISSLGVIAAILVGGGFFGVKGMFFGVPVFACIRCFLDFVIEVRLRKKNLPVNTEAYSTGSPRMLRVRMTPSEEAEESVGEPAEKAVEMPEKASEDPEKM